MDVMSDKLRLDWIDWMKTLAMYFVIAGHNSVPGSKYIYVFSVPCFFLISGFLAKKESENRTFWLKLWWNLLVPMSLFAAINLLYVIGIHLMTTSFNSDELYMGLLMCVIGNQGQDANGLGLGALWFVYTLVICKILFQYSPKKNMVFWLIVESVVFLAIAVQIHNEGIVLYNSWTNVLLALPFFTFGYLLHPIKTKINAISNQMLFVFMFVGIVGVWICGSYNDIVHIYKCSYGSSIFLCLSGAISGTLIVYAFSMLIRMRLQGFTRQVGGVH